MPKMNCQKPVYLRDISETCTAHYLENQMISARLSCSSQIWRSWQLPLVSVTVLLPLLLPSLTGLGENEHYAKQCLSFLI